MLTCNSADFLYRLVPVRAWRAFLVRVHFERCPICREGLAGAAEARSFFVAEAEFSPSEALWRKVNSSLAGADENVVGKARAAAGSRMWRWSAAAVVVAFLAGYWAFKDFRPDNEPALAVAPARFELEYVRVGGRPADAYVYQAQGSDLVMVWAGISR